MVPAWRGVAAFTLTASMVLSDKTAAIAIKRAQVVLFSMVLSSVTLPIRTRTEFRRQGVTLKDRSG